MFIRYSVSTATVKAQRAWLPPSKTQPRPEPSDADAAGGGIGKKRDAKGEQVVLFGGESGEFLLYIDEKIIAPVSAGGVRP